MILRSQDNEIYKLKLCYRIYSDCVIGEYKTVKRATKILEVNTTKINEYADKGILRKFYVDGSSHNKFWLSDVKAFSKEII